MVASLALKANSIFIRFECENIVYDHRGPRVDARVLEPVEHQASETMDIVHSPPVSGAWPRVRDLGSKVP